MWTAVWRTEEEGLGGGSEETTEQSEGRGDGAVGRMSSPLKGQQGRGTAGMQVSHAGLQALEF